MKEEEIEESSSSVRFLRTGSGRWVDGSEVDSESPPWSLLDDEEIREGYGSVRRRLSKKPKRVDSFDVEAMEIVGAHGHHNKVETLVFFLSPLNFLASFLSFIFSIQFVQVFFLVLDSIFMKMCRYI